MKLEWLFGFLGASFLFLTGCDSDRRADYAGELPGTYRSESGEVLVLNEEHLCQYLGALPCRWSNVADRVVLYSGDAMQASFQRDGSTLVNEMTKKRYVRAM